MIGLQLLEEAEEYRCNVTLPLGQRVPAKSHWSNQC